mgnify:CR=1 FL=1
MADVSKRISTFVRGAKCKKEGHMLSGYKPAVIRLSGFLLLRMSFQKWFNFLSQIDGWSKGLSRALIVRWIILGIWPKTTPMLIHLWRCLIQTLTWSISFFYINWPRIFISTFSELLFLTDLVALLFFFFYLLHRPMRSSDGRKIARSEIELTE